MAKTAWRGGALIAPVPPAMISCGTMETSNIIKESGEFVINLTTEALIHAADYCGMYTGAKVDKFAVCELHKEEVPGFSCPMIAESPLSLACRVTEIVPMGSHDMFIADVVAVHVDESLIDAAGKLHLEHAHLAAYAHGEYYGLGKKLGWFGFSAVKKKKKKPAPHAQTQSQPHKKKSEKHKPKA